MIDDALDIDVDDRRRALAADDTAWKVRAVKNAERVRERVSPSQVTTFAECNRKWFLSSVMGLRTPSTPAQRLGTRIHAEAEHYYETGEVRPGELERITRALLEKMPPRGPLIEVEKWVETSTYDGGPLMRGRGDVLVADPDRPHVFDPKSTSDVRKYGKKEHQIPEHIQLNIYARVAALRFPNARAIGQTLVHVQTRGRPHTDAPTVWVERERVLEIYEAMTSRVRQMMSVINGPLPTFEDVAPNLDACDMYRGCEYRGVCGEGGRAALVQLRASSLLREETEVKPEPEKKESADMENGTNGLSLLEQMKADAAAKGANGEVTKAAPPPAVAAVTPPPAVITAPPPADASKGGPMCPGCAGARYLLQADKTWLMCKSCGGSGFAVVTQTSASPPLATQQVVPPDAPPRVNETTVEAAPPAAEEKKKKTKKTDDATRAEIKADGPIVLVDCIVTKGRGVSEAVDYLEWLAPIMDAVAAGALNERGEPKPVADWRMIPYTSEGSLAVAIRAAIKAGKLPPVVAVHGDNRARAPFLECVIPVASLVVRGV